MFEAGLRAARTTYIRFLFLIFGFTRLGECVCVARPPGSNVGALIIRLRFVGVLYFIHNNKEPQNGIGNYLNFKRLS